VTSGAKRRRSFVSALSEEAIPTLASREKGNRWIEGEDKFYPERSESPKRKKV